MSSLNPGKALSRAFTLPASKNQIADLTLSDFAPPIPRLLPGITPSSVASGLPSLISGPIKAVEEKINPRRIFKGGDLPFSPLGWTGGASGYSSLLGR